MSVDGPSGIEQGIEPPKPTPKPAIEQEQAEAKPNWTKIFLKTFEYSQGGGEENQKPLYEYLHELRPGWKISDVERAQIVEGANAYANARFVKPGTTAESVKEDPKGPTHKSLTQTDVHYGVKQEIDRMIQVINSDDLSHHAPDVVEMFRKQTAQRIAINILNRDFHYLFTKRHEGGRPRSGNPRQERFDPWLSHLRFYAGEGHGTGVPEFDQMFREVGDVVRRRLQSGQWQFDRNFVPKSGLAREVDDNGNLHEEIREYGADMKDNTGQLSLMAKIWEEKHPGQSYMEPFTRPAQPEPIAMVAD
jgi:hypothetical protein